MAFCGEKGLPFPRGDTYAQFETGLLDADFGLHLVGREYIVSDTIHDTGCDITLRIVKIDEAVTIPGTADTPLHKLYSFATDELDFGRMLDGGLSGAGVVCAGLDDAYAGAKVIAQYDLAYILVDGPCALTTGASNVSLSAHDPVASDANGCVAAASCAAGQWPVGTIDQASTDEDTEVVVWMNKNRTPPPAAG